MEVDTEFDQLPGGLPGDIFGTAGAGGEALDDQRDAKRGRGRTQRVLVGVRRASQITARTAPPKLAAWLKGVPPDAPLQRVVVQNHLRFSVTASVRSSPGALLDIVAGSLDAPMGIPQSHVAVITRRSVFDAVILRRA